MIENTTMPNMHLFFFVDQILVADRVSDFDVPTALHNQLMPAKYPCFIFKLSVLFRGCKYGCTYQDRCLFQSLSLLIVVRKTSDTLRTASETNSPAVSEHSSAPDDWNSTFESWVEPVKEVVEKGDCSLVV